MRPPLALPPSLPIWLMALMLVVWVLVVGAGLLAVLRLRLGLVTDNRHLVRKGGKTLGLLVVIWGITSALLYVGWRWHILH